MNRPNDPQDPQNFQNRGRPQLRGGTPATPPRRTGVVDMPNLRRADSPSPTPRYPSEGRRLVVGKDITLAGQISKCDFLIVEGAVEGMRYDGQSLEVAESGVFSGNIEVDNADISGSFEGSMSVKNRLTIRPTGKVSGTIRYTELEVNAGGQITGEIKVIETAVSRAKDSMSAILNEAGSDSVTTSARMVGE